MPDSAAGPAEAVCSEDIIVHAVPMLPFGRRLDQGFQILLLSALEGTVVYIRKIRMTITVQCGSGPMLSMVHTLP